MIRIHKVIIHEFRGIRELTLEMQGENFVVCGANGTGKSGIIDAVEFALTGNISRLSGEGTKDLSLMKHGPHVDSVKSPEHAYVELAFSIVASNKQASIRRTIKDFSRPSITPHDDPEVKTVLKHIEKHPEFVLSRRELMRYITAKPGDRSKEIQALLRLDRLEELRLLFQRIYKASEKEAKQLKQNQHIAQEELIRALGITHLSATTLLTAVNTHRALLSLPDILQLQNSTSIKEGLTTTNTITPISKIPKAQALEDIKNLKNSLNVMMKLEFKTVCQSALGAMIELNANAAELEQLSKKNLLEIALEFFNDIHCPVCDTAWDAEKFRVLINYKLTQLTAIQKKKTDLEKALEPITKTLDNVACALKTVSEYAPQLTNPIDVQPLKTYESMLLETKIQLCDLLPLQKTIHALDVDLTLPDLAKAALREIEQAVEAIPDPSSQDAAREYLILGQERLEKYREISRQLKVMDTRTKTAKYVNDQYVKVMDAELEKIYSNVEQRFSDLYRMMNSSDEGAFDAKLTSLTGKIDLSVDFYGRGFFPPGAYHSEGHQDSMGLCLYLALMRYALGDHFTLAVFDDVLVSVDAGHRRAVCALLKQQFPNTQFILTTHDDTWLQHMKTAGLIQNHQSMQLKTWDVNVGAVG